jgi:hypothetical protein
MPNQSSQSRHFLPENPCAAHSIGHIVDLGPVSPLHPVNIFVDFRHENHASFLFLGFKETIIDFVILSCSFFAKEEYAMI